MFCPRCGAENEEGSRYCASCGNELPKTGSAAAGKEAEKASGGGKGLDRLIGEDRRTRLITIATVVALLAAVIAFVALDSAGEDEEAALPQDAVTRELDDICVRHKGEIARAQKDALGEGGSAAVGRYAESFVPIVGTWRSELGRIAIPSDRTDRVDALKAALLEVQIESGALARAVREGKRKELVAAAGDLEVATANVEAAIDEMELQKCRRLVIAQGRLVRQ